MRAVAWVLALCAPAYWACTSAPICPREDCGVTQSPGASEAGEAGAASASPSGGGEGGGGGGEPTLGGAAGADSRPEGGAAEGGAEAAEADGGDCGGCYARPVVVGTLQGDALSEISGIVASVRNPGVYYVHNDSGDTARFFAIDEQGRTLAEVVLRGATAVDWEDIALGPGPDGRSFIYLGDVGDNNARVGATPRAGIDVYRVAEPLIVLDEEPRYLEVSEWARLPLAYPGVAHDCEAVLLDPESSELLLVTKENDGISSIFRASGLADSAQTLELAGTVSFGTAQAPGSALVTGGELSPTGDEILLRTYTSVFLWPRAQGADIAAALSAAPRQLPAPDEEQGEAITFSADGLSYVSVSESEHAQIFRARLCDL